VGVNPSAELSSRVGDIPSTELSPEWRHIPLSEYERNPTEGNYRRFIRL